MQVVQELLLQVLRRVLTVKMSRDRPGNPWC